MASFEPRGKSVRAVVRLPNKKKVSATFDTQRDAERWAAEIEAKKALGAIPTSKASGITNAQLFELFGDAVASKTDSTKWNMLRLRKWMGDPLSKKRVVDTTTHDINQWISRNLSAPSKRTGKPLSSNTVTRELTLLSSAFQYAVKSLKWIKENPCHGALRPPAVKAKKHPLLSLEQVKMITAASGYDTDPELTSYTARVGACYLFALETGMRSGEILRIRPEDYWRDRRTVHVAAIDRGGRKAARSGRASGDPSRNVPLTDRATELLDQLLRTMPADQKPSDGFAHPPYIVGLNDAQRDALWRKIRDRSGVPDVTFHHMKHEAATRLAKFLDVIALSYAIGTKDLKLLRDTYYNNDASRSAALLPGSLAPTEASEDAMMAS